MTTLAEAGKAFAAALQGDLDQEMDRLGVTGTELRARAKRALETQSAAILLQLGGQDATIEKQAAESSFASLKAAGAQALANSIQGLIFKGVQAVFKTAMVLI